MLSIVQLDHHLRQFVVQPNDFDLKKTFDYLRQCYTDHQINNDQLYVPTLLLLRQFPKITDAKLFDEIFIEFISLFSLIPIRSKKILDEFLCLISLILTKKIVESHDEVQQNLFVRFFRSFLQSIKTDEKFFFNEFLGDFKRNLPIIGHFFSSFLQLFERISSLDFRLEILETFSTLIFTSNIEHRQMIGRILASFLPGILKTLAFNLGSVHQRLVQTNLRFLTYVLHLSLQHNEHSIDNYQNDLLVERNDVWLNIVDTHLLPILNRFTNDYLYHENVSVRRALAIFMLNILFHSPSNLKLSIRTALKTLLIFAARKNLQSDEKFVEILFQIDENSSMTFDAEMFQLTNLKISDEILLECQSDLFVLLDENPSNHRKSLQLFTGFYRFLHRNIDDLFQMENFREKFWKFLLKNLDFQHFIRTGTSLLRQTTPSETKFDRIEYLSIYKHFRLDVEDEIDELFKFYLRSNENFIDFLFEQIDRRSIINETNDKIFYLISIIFTHRQFDRIDDHRILLTLLTELISNDDQRKKRSSSSPSISMRNLTIFLLLQTLTTITRVDHIEFLIDYLPILLLCHSSRYTIIHRTSMFSLTKFDENLSTFLHQNAENLLDRSIRNVRSSNLDGYFILIEFVRLGGNLVVNHPVMTHVIEELLLELSSCPSIDSIRLTFEFFSIFCQQVVDIVEKKKRQVKISSSTSTSFVDFVLNLQNESQPKSIDEDESTITDENEKHPWHQMIVSIVDVFQHFISSADRRVRSFVLDAFPSLARLLSTIDENLFLPLVHKIWPGLVRRISDEDFNIRIRCLTTLECLSQICSDFIDRRIQQDFLPIFLQQLERYRSISSTHSLEYRYMKNFLTKIASILNVVTIQFDQIEEIILYLFLYLQNELLAPFAIEQLKILTKKYADEIWLKLVLHDENENRQRYFPQMKVYKAQPQLTLDPKWKSTLIDCLNRC